MKADEVLESLGVNFEVVEQDNPTVDCENAAEERGLETCQIVKSLIVDKDGEFFHVLIPGDRKLSATRFGDHAMVDPEESKELTGFGSGVIHPFSSEVEHVVDNKVFENDDVSFTTGEKLRGVIIRIEEFRQALEEANFPVEYRDIVEPVEEEYDAVEQKGLSSDRSNFIIDKGFETVFHQKVSEFTAEKIFWALERLNRENIDFKSNMLDELLERGETETHMHKLVEHYKAEGDFPDENSFDLDEVVDEVLYKNPTAVEDLENGKDSAVNYLLGQVMQETSGRADPERTQKVLRRKV